VSLQPETIFDFDLLGATKIIPEEEVPLRVVGRMVLDRNPDNLFAETGSTKVDRPLLTVASVLYDSVPVAGGPDSVDALRGNGAAVRYVAEAYKHAKPIGAFGDGVDLLRDAPLEDAKLSENGLAEESGVVTLASPGNGNGDLDAFAEAFANAVAAHRHFDRNLAAVPA
jgi:catalase